MMPPIRKLLACVACAASTLALIPSSALAAPQLVLSGPSSATAGGSLQIDVLASDMRDLYAFQFDILFDATRFSVSGVTEGAWLASAGSTFFDAGTVDPAAGSIGFLFGTLIGPGAGVSGSGRLAQLSFLVNPGVLGSGSFQIANALAFDAALNPIELGLQGITVAVPEPASLSMMLAGLALGAGVLASRRTRRPAHPRTVPQRQA